jgi:hypothetical protein
MSACSRWFEVPQVSICAKRVQYAGHWRHLLGSTGVVLLDHRICPEAIAHGVYIGELVLCKGISWQKIQSISARGSTLGHPSVSSTHFFRAPVYLRYPSIIFPSASRVLKSTNNCRFILTPPRSQNVVSFPSRYELINTTDRNDALPFQDSRGFGVRA